MQSESVAIPNESVCPYLEFDTSSAESGEAVVQACNASHSANCRDIWSEYPHRKSSHPLGLTVLFLIDPLENPQ